MKLLSSPADVRKMGRLPDGLTDDQIRPHLSGAGRLLASWLSPEYLQLTGDAKDAAREAEICVCMAYLVPVMHTFYTEGAAAFQRESAESEFVFLSPGQAETVAEQWMDRARRAADAAAGIASPAGSAGLQYAAI